MTDIIIPGRTIPRREVRVEAIVIKNNRRWIAPENPPDFAASIRGKYQVAINRVAEDQDESGNYLGSEVGLPPVVFDPADRLGDQIVGMSVAQILGIVQAAADTWKGEWL